MNHNAVQCTIPIPLNEPFSNDAITAKREGMNNEVLQDIHGNFYKQRTPYCCNYLSTNAWWLTLMHLRGWQYWRQVAIELLALDCSTPMYCPRSASCPRPIKRLVLTQAVFWLTPKHREETQKEACQRERSCSTSYQIKSYPVKTSHKTNNIT